MLRQFNLRATQENLSKFKIARAKARRTIKQSKRASWRQYVSRLNSRSSVKKTLEMIRKINGKNSTLNVGHLNVGDNVVTSKAGIADVLADTLAEKSSSSNYSTFQKFQITKEKIKLNFKSNNDEHYNKDFTIKELRKALKKCHDTAVGCDDIYYQFLKHLPFLSLDSLRRIFNHVWHTGILPDSWKEAIVIPIPKPGKDSTNPANYRPIARVGDTFSNPHEQEMGDPQGSILSVTLVSVKINNIVKSVCPGVECFLYVDDFCICYRSKHMHTIERQLQQVLNNLSKWSSENGFKFSNQDQMHTFLPVKKIALRF